jgi:hypothetical protein
MNSYRILPTLLCVVALSACEKNAVQVLPTDAPAASRIRFFNFGVSAPGVNFYADNTKMTAITSSTNTEATTGVTYGSVGNGGTYSAIAPGTYTFAGKIAATTDKDLAISNLPATLDSGKVYSFYQSGIYDAVAKTIDAFLVEDDFAPEIDYTVAYVRFVHAISNANPLTLYVRNQADTTLPAVAVSGAVAYKGASAFVALPNGIYDLFARYTDSTTNTITRTGVSFVAGKVYTVGARGNITITSTTSANRPILDNTANR